MLKVSNENRKLTSGLAKSFLLGLLCTILFPISVSAFQSEHQQAFRTNSDQFNLKSLIQDSSHNRKIQAKTATKTVKNENSNQLTKNESLYDKGPEKSLLESFGFEGESLTDRKQIHSTLRFALTVGALSLAPALVLMSTSFVRIMVVLVMLRQALGAQQMPPTQVITTLALFMSLLIMTPVWSEIKTEALDPYSQETISWQAALDKGVLPIKKFMSRQIDMANNSDDIWLFYNYLPEKERNETPTTYEEVPLKVLLPAFLISELKIAFIIGVQVYLPFLIIDVVVSSVTVSMGMMMLPPTMLSLPLKILLFVMVDGWTLIVGMLLESFAPYS